MTNMIKCVIAIKIKLLLFAILISGVSYGNTQVIGLKINESSLDYVKKIYDLKLKGESTYSIDVNNIGVNDVKNAFVGFYDNKLKVVGLKFNDDKFDYLFDILNEKYQLLDSETNRSSNRYAIFKNEGDLIIINSPFKSFDLEVTYVDEEYNKKVKENVEDRKENLYLKDKSNL